MDQAVLRAAVAHAAIDVAQSDRPPTLYQVVSPMVRTVLDSFNGELITPTEFGERLKQTLGWYLPHSACEAIFQGFVADGLGTRAGAAFQARPSERRNVPIPDPNALVAPIVAFVEATNPLYLPRQKVDDLLEAVFNHVLYDGRVHEAATPPQVEAAYWVARFFESEARATGKIGGLAWIKNLGIACSVIEYFTFSSEVHPQAKAIDVFLDGPVLLEAMGFGVAEATAESREAIASLRTIGCRVRLFRHSIYEATEIVSAILRKGSTERRGDVAVALASGRLNESVLKQFVASPGPLIQSTLEIRKADIINAHDTGNEDYFSEEDWSILYGRLSWYDSDVARERDCDSARAIMQLRAGVATTDPWDAKALFVTTNSRLMMDAKTVCVQQNLMDEAHVGPMAARGALAGLLWMSGMQPSAEKLSMLEIARQAMNVVALRPEWTEAIERSLGEIDRLDPLLKQGFLESPAFTRIAIDRVGGRTERINTDVVREALEQYEEKVTQKRVDAHADSARKERRIKESVIQGQAAQN